MKRPLSLQFGLLIGAASLLAACATPNGIDRNTGIGAGVGALAGSVVGAAVAHHGNKNEGALAGAAIGGILGGAVGQNYQIIPRANGGYNQPVSQPASYSGYKNNGDDCYDNKRRTASGRVILDCYSNQGGRYSYEPN